MNLYNKIKNGVYMIAEMSANHAGSLDTALEIVIEAKKAGADCIKIQTYTADTLTINCDKEQFRLKGGLWDGYTYYDLYKEAYTPWEWQKSIKDKCDEIGIDFLSTPFDITAVDFLEGLGIEFYKIASFELVDIPLIEYVASKGKPIIMSCGMASVEEIEEAVSACKKFNNHQIILLKCCSQYPANYQDMNVATIQDMQLRFGLPIGLSDHSMGSLASVVAVSMGAIVIEKHVCLSRSIQSADSAFSMEIQEYRDLVKDVNDTLLIQGQATYELTDKEKAGLAIRRSLYAVKDIKEGEPFTKDNVRSIRPGYGIMPKHYDELLKNNARKSYEYGDPINPIEIGKLLRAVWQDRDLLYEWTNEEAVRKNSLNTKRIEYLEHIDWFRNKLGSEACDIYIYYMDEKPVGQIRLDYKDGCGWISFSIDHNYRGQGHGKILLMLAEEEVLRRRLDIHLLAGVVKANNLVSQRRFEELKYIKSGEGQEKDLLYYQKKI